MHLRSPALARLGAFVGVVALLFTFGVVQHPGTALASSHREAPLISDDPPADGTDFYMFTDPTDATKVVFVMNTWPLEDPAGGPNFFRFGENVLYSLHISNNGKATDQIRFDFDFSTQFLSKNTTIGTGRPPGSFLYNKGPIASIDDPNLLLKQTYTVSRTDQVGAARQFTPLVQKNAAELSNYGMSFWRFNEEASTQAQPAATSQCTTGTGGKDIKVPPVFVGINSFGNTPAAAKANYETIAASAVTPITCNGVQYDVWAGQRADPFFVDVAAIFDLLKLRDPLGTTPGFQGIDLLTHFNVQSIVLRAPKSAIKAGTEPVIGAWMTSSRPSMRVLNTDNQGRGTGTESHTGPYVQVSRLGMPLVNEVVIPIHLKDYFNGTRPEQDGAALDYVLKPEVATLLTVLYPTVFGAGAPGGPIPTENRTDLVDVFLKGLPGLNQPANVEASEMLRLNLNTPLCSGAGCNPLGVVGGDNQGFPNGRRLSDDVTDVTLKAACGALVSSNPQKANCAKLTQDVANPMTGPTPPRPLLATFPYLTTPWDGFQYVPQ